MISRTRSGVDLYSRLRIIALSATDLPDPVVPATSTCGILAMSAITGLPPMLLPSASVNGEAERSNSSERMISDRKTVWRTVFGISRPIVVLPGITSTTRTEITLRPRARSLARLLIWADLMPAAGCSSKRVITGPGCTSTTSTCTPKSASLSSTWRDSASSTSVL